MSKNKKKNHKEKNIIRLGVPTSTLSASDFPTDKFYLITIQRLSTNSDYVRPLLTNSDQPKYLYNAIKRIYNKWVVDRNAKLKIMIYRDDHKMWVSNPETMTNSKHLYTGDFTQELFDTITESWSTLDPTDDDWLLN